MRLRQYHALNTYLKFSPWRAFNFTTFLGSLTLSTNRNLGSPVHDRLSISETFGSPA